MLKGKQNMNKRNVKYVYKMHSSMITNGYQWSSMMNKLAKVVSIYEVDVFTTLAA